METTADLADLVALSFLPVACRYDVAERLRTNQSPRDIVAEVTARLWPDRLDKRDELRRRVATALADALARDVTPIGFSSPSYPIALTTIADPPPLIWTRGS